MKFLSCLLCFCCIQLQAQALRVKGIVKDKKSGTPLSFVSVGFTLAGTGGFTDAEGRFELFSEKEKDTLRVYMVGYKELLRPVSIDETLTLALEEDAQVLQEISVQAAKAPRYRNKDNPAVALIRRVIDHKDLNYHKSALAFTFEQYEKQQMSLVRNTDRKGGKADAALNFVFQNGDTVSMPGRSLVPFMLHEKAIRRYGSPAATRDIVLGEKRTSLDGIIDDEGLQAYFDKIYARTDIYDNNIMIGDQQFLSPIAGTGPTFYKYFITDTLKDNLPWRVKIEFYPRNKADVLFKGSLLIALDSSYAVQAAVLGINSKINLNWVDDLHIALAYERDSEGLYHQSENRLGILMSLFSKKGGVYGERLVSVKNYRTGITLPDSISAAQNAVPLLTEADWQQVRHQSLSATESKVYDNLDTLKKSRKFRRAANIFTLLFSGYEELGPVEVGPVNSFYSFNPVEGFRLKLGGRTTEQFHKKLMLDGHLAYGFRDKQWKYSLGASYSLTDHSVFEYPIRAISFHHSYETRIPGQDLTFLEEDNFLLSFKRGNNNKWLYDKKWNLEYYHETDRHLSFKVSFNHNIIEPGGMLSFGSGTREPFVRKTHLELSEFAAELRWAPHEQFYQGKKFRRPIFNSYPVFTLRTAMGVKGIFGSSYSYRSVTLNVFKRFYLSQLGFSDVVLEGGRIYGHIPYPLMYIHKANQTYAYQLQSYNLMNFMEFISDRYVSLSVDHSFNGFFFNKIPLVRKLQLREVGSFKAVYGTIGKDNRPESGSETSFHFPQDDPAKKMSHRLDNGPYIEASFGVSNIFKILRIDVVKRFTYLDHPGIAEWGIRGRIVLAL